MFIGMPPIFPERPSSPGWGKKVLLEKLPKIECKNVPKCTRRNLRHFVLVSAYKNAPDFFREHLVLVQDEKDAPEKKRGRSFLVFTRAHLGTSLHKTFAQLSREFHVEFPLEALRARELHVMGSY